METDFDPAIAALKKRLEEAERKPREIRRAINMLCEAAGRPHMYSETEINVETSTATLTQIGPDTFYGKVLQTACREYLAMRKAQSLGPAKPREIYDALEAGGFQFEAKDAETSLIAMRALLRKRYTIFHKLPNGTYGLTAWYPNAKQPKDSSANDRNASEESNDDSDE